MEDYTPDQLSQYIDEPYCKKMNLSNSNFNFFQKDNIQMQTIIEEKN